MSHLPDRWRRYAWIAVSAAIAAVSHWMFFSATGSGRPDHKASPIARRDIRPSVSPTGTISSLIDGQRPERHA